jgi:hypothetical protein
MPAASAPAPAPDTAALRLQTAQRARSGAHWFYWIAGVTLINSLINVFGSDWNFIFGLGIGQVFDALGQGLAAEGGGGTFVALGLLMSVGALSTYVLWGWLAARGRTLGFVAGMIFYALDTGIFLVAGDWLGAAFHVFALVVIGRGFRAHRELRAMPDDESAAVPDPERDAVQEIVAAVEEEERRELVS